MKKFPLPSVSSPLLEIFVVNVAASPFFAPLCPFSSLPHTGIGLYWVQSLRFLCLPLIVSLKYCSGSEKSTNDSLYMPYF